MRQVSSLVTCLSAKAADGIGNNIFVQDYKTVVIELWFAAATLTVKCQGSVSEDAPTFSSAQALANHWDYIDMIDLEDNASIDGDTGVASAGAASDARIFEVNTNGLNWLNFIVSSRTAGSVTVKVRGFYE